jgi:hypothetical protein
MPMMGSWPVWVTRFVKLFGSEWFEAHVPRGGRTAILRES